VKRNCHDLAGGNDLEIARWLAVAVIVWHRCLLYV
jgi:hypothetical protein